VTFSLEGRTAVVTGASRGIGRAIAAALAEAGADIVGVASTPVSAEAARTDVERHGASYRALGADLGDRDEVYRLTREIRELVGVPDVLVLAAGINRRSPAADFPDDAWDEVLATNLTAPFQLAREVGREMVERGSGRIIFLASLLSFQGGLTVPAYAASKGGVASLVKAFANEWASRGVGVNAIAPGYVATDMNTALIADPVRQRQLLERIPAGHWASPEDIAGAAVFLASPAASYIHGVVLPVDGGWLGR
jgi:2-deoxy-D-gluconate 3-dehydrogenase